MTAIELLGAVLIIGICLPVAGIIACAVWWALEDRGRHSAPRRPVWALEPPAPYWGTPRDDHTVRLDPVAAEWATEWPDPPPWSPWEHPTGWFPAIIERMGQR